MLKKIQKAILIFIVSIINIGFCYFILNAYNKRIPPESVGSCIIFDPGLGNQNILSLVAGKIVSNSITYGESTVEIAYDYYKIKLHAKYSTLRKRGYIRIDCNEI